MPMAAYSRITHANSSYTTSLTANARERKTLDSGPGMLATSDSTNEFAHRNPVASGTAPNNQGANKQDTCETCSFSG